MSRTRLPSPLRPRLRSRRAASAICSVSSIRRFLIHRFLIRCLPSARRIQRLPQQSAMRCNRVCVQPMTRHPPCVSLSLPRGRRAQAGPRRRAAQPSDASPAAQVDLRTLGYSQQQQRRSNRRCVRQWRSTTRHWWAMGLHTRTSLRSANTGSVRDRCCHVSGHNQGVARGDTRRHRWRRQTVVRRTRPGGLAHGGEGVERSAVTVGHRPTSQDCKTWRRDRSGGSACMAQCTDGCP